MQGHCASLADDRVFGPLFDQLPDAIVVVDRHRRVLEANRAARGFANLAEITGTSGAAERPRLADVTDHTGRVRTFSVSELTLAPNRIAVVARDVTEQRELEDTVAQMQRVDSLGYVTASVVHDFGNLLMPMVALSAVMAKEFEAGSRLSGLAFEMQSVVSRAVELIRQLRGFVHREPGRAVRLSPNVVMTEMLGLIERVVGEMVPVTVSLDGDVGDVTVDRVKLEQIVLNLVTNSRDAMPMGGHLIIATTLVDLTEAQAASRDCPCSGSYVALSVADTGVGMAPEVLSRAFERFFTTKQAGRGTGLGLAIARSIALSHGGCIRAESEPGRGTTVTLYLPRARSEDESPAT